MRIWMMPPSFCAFCGVSNLAFNKTFEYFLFFFFFFFVSVAVQMDLTEILKCQHFFGTDLSLGMTVMSPCLQDTVVKLSHGLALPEGKGQKEWVLVQGRKILPRQWGSISPQDAGVLWGAGVPLLN